MTKKIKEFKDCMLAIEVNRDKLFNLPIDASAQEEDALIDMINDLEQKTAKILVKLLNGAIDERQADLMILAKSEQINALLARWAA